MVSNGPKVSTMRRKTRDRSSNLDFCFLFGAVSRKTSDLSLFVQHPCNKVENRADASEYLIHIYDLRYGRKYILKLWPAKGLDENKTSINFEYLHNVRNGLKMNKYVINPPASLILHLFTLVFYVCALLCVFTPKDNRALTSDLQRKIYPNGTMVIGKVSKDYVEGAYECTARNRQGLQSSTRTHIHVIGESLKVFWWSVDMHNSVFKSEKKLGPMQR